MGGSEGGRGGRSEGWEEVREGEGGGGSGDLAIIYAQIGRHTYMY